MNNIRAEILADNKKFWQCLTSGTSAEELGAILAQIKEKEALLIKKENVMCGDLHA